ncbi:MAG: hypothetical protein WKF87_01270 [Chryseolinea sp.]
MDFRRILICLLLILGINPLAAQSLSVEDGKTNIDEKNDVDAWVTTLDQDVAFCMDSYESFMKETFKVKVYKQSKGLLMAEKFAIAEISVLRIDQRAAFTLFSGGTTVTFTFSPGYDIHFNPKQYKAEFAKAGAFVKNYVRYHYKTFYDEQIKSLQNKIDSRHRDIESNGRKADKIDKAIAQNKSDDETDKTKAKSEKMLRENESYTADTATKRKEISDLEDQLSKANEALRKALAFK